MLVMVPLPSDTFMWEMSVEGKGKTVLVSLCMADSTHIIARRSLVHT